MSDRIATPDSPGTGSPAPEQSLFSNYPIDPRFYDEMFDAEAVPRDHCRELWNVLDGMAPEEIAAMQERAERSFLQEGITFAVYGEAGAQERIIPIDVVPRIVDADTWEFIERGLRQRLKALNLFLADIYGRGRILSDGVIPADMVLEDNLRVPSGVSYMLANRGAVKSSLNNLFRQYRVRGIEHYGSLLRQTLSELAPPGVTDPLLSHSIRHALDRIAASLEAVSAQRPLALGAVRRVGRVAANLDFDWPRRDPGDDAATRATLRMIGDECRRLNEDIEMSYFNYEIEDSPQ